jgi:hypothetical protein
VPDYVVMFPADDEPAWAAGSEADHQSTYDVDGEFVALLEAAGGAVTGGAQLAPSSAAHTLRPGAAAVSGPPVAGPAQLSGFFLVTAPDGPALLAAAEVLTRAHPVVEVRPVVSGD